MKNKQLSRWQVNYLNILSKFNFQIIFRSGKMNTKVNALIRMLLANVFESAQCLENRFQTILIFDRVDVLSIELKANLYQQVWMINQIDEFCSEYRQAMNENKLKFHIIKLKNCEIIDDVLFRKDLLWVFENMHTKLLQEVHDQSSIFHFDNKRIIDLVQRFYYWSDHRATIQWYIWNCHACQRSKASRDNINELHHSLSISQKRWKDIVMNFITELSLSEDYNVICTIICHLIKEHHYVLCHWEDDDISVEETVWIMLWNVYRLHDLLSSIVSNRDSQFISTMWKSLCNWESQLFYSQSIILKLMINRNKSIKMLNANLESTAITCRTTESNEYLWWNSVTISISSRSLQWFSSTSIKNFTLKWVSIQIRLTTKQLVNDLKLEKQMILSFEWKSYWTSIINNWKRRSWSSKFRSINIDETSSMK